MGHNIQWRYQEISYVKFPLGRLKATIKFKGSPTLELGLPVRWTRFQIRPVRTGLPLLGRGRDCFFSSPG